MTVAVTGHHLILSLAEGQEKQGPREIWLLHRNIQVLAPLPLNGTKITHFWQAIGRGEESGGRSGTIALRSVETYHCCLFFETDREDPLVRYKDLRLIHLDIIGTDKYSALLQSLEQLAQVAGKRGCCGFHEYFSGEGADCILSLLLQSRLPRT